MLHLTRSRIQEAKEPEKYKETRNQNSLLSIGKVDPPVVGKVSHHSIQLNWEKLEKPGEKGDRSRIKYAIQEEDKRTLGFGTVYVGYADNYNVEGLEPSQLYKYRLKVTNEKGEAAHSPTIEVRTTKKPFNSLHLHKAINLNNIIKIKEILQSHDVNLESCDKLGFTPLMSASQMGNVNIVDILLANGADVNAVNSSGKTSLMMACFGGHQDVVEKLGAAGASWDNRDRGGSTAMHWAVDSGNPHLIKWMLKNGAMINIKDTTAHWTPILRCAALSGNVEVAECLINAGSNVNARDKDDKTALMIASLNGHFGLVKLLVTAGAEVEAKSKYGKTAREMAKSFDRRNIIEYFDEISTSEHEN